MFFYSGHYFSWIFSSVCCFWSFNFLFSLYLHPSSFYIRIRRRIFSISTDFNIQFFYFFYLLHRQRFLLFNFLSLIPLLLSPSFIWHMFEFNKIMMPQMKLTADPFTLSTFFNIRSICFGERADLSSSYSFLCLLIAGWLTWFSLILSLVTYYRI